MNKKYSFVYNIIKPYLLKELIALIIVIISVFLSLLTPYLIKNIIDISLKNNDYYSLVVNICILVAIFIIARLFHICQSYLFTYIGEKILYDMRINLYNSITFKKHIFFNQKNTGELISRVINEIPIISNFFASTFVEILSQITTLIIALIIMFSLNKVITVISLLIIPFIYLVLKYFNPIIKNENNLMLQEKSNTNDILHENFNNIKVIKYLRVFKFAEKRFSKSLHKLIKRRFRLLRLNIISGTVLSFLNFLPTVFLFLYGGYRVIQGYLTIGSLVALNSYISRLFSPIKRLSEINLNFQKTRAAFNRYYEITMESSGFDNGDIELDKITKGIKLENIYFSYSGKNIFNNFNLTLSPGETVIFKGSNGVGKSTLINLICGIISPDQGVVEYDDINIKRIKNYSLKRIIGVVPQDTLLFNDTVRNNISFGKSVSDDRIIKLSKELGFSDVTHGTKLDLNTFINNNGGNISGGQRQKIAILRVLLFNYQILLLDEPGNFLDEESSYNLYKYISSQNQDKIIIIVSHKNLPGIDGSDIYRVKEIV